MKEFPIIGLGSVNLKRELADVFPKAFENGYRYFDTADDYGNEIDFGKSLADFKENSIISTKLSFPSRLFSLSSYFDMQKIKIGKIDIYLMHWPYPFMWKKIYTEMEELVLCGKVKHIGVCNFTYEHLKELYKFCRITPYVLQTEISPLYQQRKTVQFCNNNNLHIINYSPLAHNNPRIFENDKVKYIAKKYDQSIHNIILRWSIQKGFTPLVRTTKQSHLETMKPQNLLSFELNTEEMETIDALDSNIKVWSTPARRFNLRAKLKFLLLWLIS